MGRVRSGARSEGAARVRTLTLSEGSSYVPCEAARWSGGKGTDGEWGAGGVRSGAVTEAQMDVGPTTHPHGVLRAGAPLGG